MAGLNHLCTGPADEQREIARTLAVSLDPDTPNPVAAALLRARLSGPLNLRKPVPIDEPEYEYLVSVADETGMPVPDLHQIGSRDLLDAWINVAWARRTIHHLNRLCPEMDDIAITMPRPPGNNSGYGVIASISADGRLNFRGGRGRGARPHAVERVVKAHESDYRDLAIKAKQQVVETDPHPERVTIADRIRLEPWKITRHSSLADREALREALNTADEERPMQVVLEKHQPLLANVITGNHGIWVRPQVQLGGKYVPDFLIATETSAGLRWHLVELESPTKRLTNLKNQRESPTLRHAVDQIQDWREWLTSNLLSARQELPGITVDARGLIIMGREDPTDRADRVRDQLSRDSRIEVRTYDWLLRAAENEHSALVGLLDRETGDLNHDDDNFLV